MRRVIGLCIGVIGLCGLTVGVVFDRHTSAQGVNASGKIAFTSNRDRNLEIYVMNADGSNPANLTKTASDNYFPAWSPAADKIAFTSTRDGNPEICVMNADGGNQTCVTNNSTTNHKPDKTLPEDEYPTWAPDGLHIAFRSTRDGNMQIYVIEPTGGSPLNLSSNAFNDDQPAWSPDLRTIAFSSDRAGNPEICVKDASGFNQRCLTNNKTASGKHDPSKPSDIFPAWSPDSQQLAYVATQGVRSDMYVMNADGSNAHLLVKNVSSTAHPAWSPDGKSIAYVSPGRGKPVISLVGIDGKNPVGLTAPGAGNYAPAWQPPPPPPNATPTPMLTNTPAPTPPPPSPTPGGTSLLLGDQDVCAVPDGVTLGVPLTYFQTVRGLIPVGYAPGTFVATAGVQVSATATIKDSGITGVEVAFVQADVAQKIGVVNPVTQAAALSAGLIGATIKVPSIGTTSSFTYTFTTPTSFRIFIGGISVNQTASVSVHVTCTIVGGATQVATEAATSAATAAAPGLEIITETPTGINTPALSTSPASS